LLRGARIKRIQYRFETNFFINKIYNTIQYIDEPLRQHGRKHGNKNLPWTIGVELTPYGTKFGRHIT